MPDDPHPDPADKEQGGRILPREWLRRAAERRAREEKAAGPPQGDEMSSAVEEARRQLEEQLVRIRAGVEEMAASEEASAEEAGGEPGDPERRPINAIESLGRRVAALEEREQRGSSGVIEALEQRLRGASEHRLDLELNRIRSDVQVAGSEFRTEILDLFENLGREVAARAEELEQRWSQTVAELREESERRLLAFEHRLAGQVIDEARAALDRQSEAAGDELTRGMLARAEELMRAELRAATAELEARVTELSEKVEIVRQQRQADAKTIEEARDRVAAEAESVRAALSADAAKMSAQLQAAAAEELEARAGEALSAIQSAASAAEAHVKEAEAQTRSLAEERGAAESWLREAAQRQVAEQVSQQVEAELARRGAASADGDDAKVSQAEARIGRGVEEALASLRAETERQRAEAARQAEEAEERLGKAIEQSRRLAEGGLQEEVEQMLDNLLRDVRAIGDRLSE